METSRVFFENERENVYLDTYTVPATDEVKRPALLVIPGGGYGGIADREGAPIAEAFIPFGFVPFVLNYYTGKEAPFPIQHIEAAKAIKHIKDNAESYGIDPDAVFVVGFSAGAHLAGCSAILHAHPALYQNIDMERGYTKPRGAMLIYPVISPKYHIASFKNLLATREPTDEELLSVSLEEHVDADSAPIFIMHTSNDDMVDVRNSLCLAEAYTKAGKQYEMHVYPDAPHGIALATPITSEGKEKWENRRIAEWVRLSAEWAYELLENN